MFTIGQKVTARVKEACCPTCRSADLEVRATSSDESGVFACTRCGEPFIRAYADVTAVDPETGHAAGYPRPHVEREADDRLSRIPTGPIDVEPLGVIEVGYGKGALRDAKQQTLAQTFDRAGITVGAHDVRILDWLCRSEPSTVATVCSWILRARAAGASEEPW